MITILRPVHVKIILTEASRRALLAEYEEQRRQAEAEREQWLFQRKKLLREAEKKPAHVRRLALERIEREERALQDKLELLALQMQQVRELPEGSEIPYKTLESPVEVQVGDVWDEIMAGTDILLKDGVVHAIRRRSPRRGE